MKFSYKISFALEIINCSYEDTMLLKFLIWDKVWILYFQWKIYMDTNILLEVIMYIIVHMSQYPSIIKSLACLDR